MNSNSPRQLRSGKLISRIPVFESSKLNKSTAVEMESNTSPSDNTHSDLVEAQRNLEYLFENLKNQITEPKSLLTTLVGQNNNPTLNFDNARAREGTTRSVLTPQFHNSVEKAHSAILSLRI